MGVMIWKRKDLWPSLLIKGPLSAGAARYFAFKFKYLSDTGNATEQLYFTGTLP